MLISIFKKSALILGFILAMSIAFAQSMLILAHISTSSFTYDGDNQCDPINLLWYDEGDETVEHFADISWPNATGVTQQVYFVESIHAGRSDYWKDNDAQFQDPDGSYWGERIHLRVFESDYNDPTSGGFGDWAVGAAHEEHLAWLPYPHHVIDSWEGAEDAVVAAFEEEDYTGYISSVDYNNEGTFQNQYNDGDAATIQFTE